MASYWSENARCPRYYCLMSAVAYSGNLGPTYRRLATRMAIALLFVTQRYAQQIAALSWLPAGTQTWPCLQCFRKSKGPKWFVIRPKTSIFSTVHVVFSLKSFLGNFSLRTPSNIDWVHQNTWFSSSSHVARWRKTRHVWEEVRIRSNVWSGPAARRTQISRISTVESKCQANESTTHNYEHQNLRRWHDD